MCVCRATCTDMCMCLYMDTQTRVYIIQIYNTVCGVICDRTVLSAITTLDIEQDGPNGVVERFDGGRGL